ncbi:HEPN domain-containing protein [Pasteurella dagmatis]|uniref:RiboL-PSP-HEPN domain-containing protein n=1 Tax=Pasteurella dagmatis ATCC 43325 TaxID=667128 RepID=C9PS48_9PAST|nr:MAE_28990/MAE_18760 family HEPN-like nuclease [Pasteurella dagmatis]EEX49775.1 hypothetical protein HMPREF0621_1822 [Pasteurella dagmatis ATCC 43325]SNV71194.1 Uncharacterised protein [Pasteurella dagmatis]
MNSDLQKQIDEVVDELEEIKKTIGNGKHKLSPISKYLTHYSVVRSSGRIEFLFKKILSDKLKDDCIDSHNRIKEFITKDIMDSSCNPKTNIIEKYLSRFDPKWENCFKDSLRRHKDLNTSMNIKSDLNSLVQLRNDIAHGNSCNTSIDTIIKYYKSGTVVLNLLYDVLFQNT